MPARALRKRAFCIYKDSRNAKVHDFRHDGQLLSDRK